MDGSYGVTGMAAAAYLAGAAISRPFHGRWLDRRDATQALVMPSTLNGLARDRTIPVQDHLRARQEGGAARLVRMSVAARRPRS